MRISVEIVFLIMTLFRSTISKNKDTFDLIETVWESKIKQSDKKNLLFPPIGRPNVQSTLNSHHQSILPRGSSTSNSEYTNIKRHTDYYSRNNPSKDDINYCNVKNPGNVECSLLDGDCIDCNFDDIKNTCIYGQNISISCHVNDAIVCQGRRRFLKEIICQYCYQTSKWEQKCTGMAMCNSVGAPRNHYRANCTVIPEIICMGNRRFQRMIPCNWKNGYKWSTTLFLSITLGGFGADRFYLGRWQEGVGKLFSFGGLGLWTFIDICLVWVRYLGPADGSVYVD